MGLSVSHGCWSGSYSSFGHWRNELAKVVSIPLDLMEGHYDSENLDFVKRNSPIWMTETLERRVFNFLPIKWEVLTPDPLHVLLHHSDCDGSIEIKDMIPLIARLEAIAPLLPTDKYGFNHEDSAMKFAAGLRLAASKGEAVQFS